MKGRPLKHLEYRYTLGDQSWTLDWATLTVDDWIELRRITGYRYATLAGEHDQGDAMALKGMVWMARRKSGEGDLEWSDPSMSFVLTELRREILRDDMTPKAKQGQGEEAGPTKAPRAPRTRTPRKTSKNS